jgi:hypothetical protein
VQSQAKKDEEAIRRKMKEVIRATNGSDSVINSFDNLDEIE